MSPDEKLLAALGPLPRAEDVLPRQSRTDILDAAVAAVGLLDEGDPTAARAVLWRVIAVERLGREGAARLEAERMGAAEVPIPPETLATLPTLADFIRWISPSTIVSKLRLVDGRVVEIDLRNPHRAVYKGGQMAGHVVDGNAMNDPRSGRSLRALWEQSGEEAVREALGLPAEEPLPDLRARVASLRDRREQTADVTIERAAAEAELARRELG